MNNTYKQLSKATAEILSLTEVKNYLRVDDTTDDTLIGVLINTAISYAEKYMGIDLLETVWENYRDGIEQDLTLRRARFLSVSGIQYMHDGTYALVSADDYQVAGNGVYGKVERIEMPDSYDDSPEAIKIVFKTGFGATGSDVPADIKTALMAHIACMYENRGDCAGVENIPTVSRLIYGNYRVVDLNGVF